MAIRGALLIGFVVVVIADGGCSTPRRRHNDEWGTNPAERNSLEAQRTNEEGLRMLGEGSLDEAEVEFRESVRHDLYYVPAHNNLGVVLLRKGNYYEAAWEFHCAAKLMPHAAEPRANLGLLYEQLGRLDRAIDEYQATLEIDPASIATMRHLARTYVKTGRKDDGLKSLLETLLGTPDGGQWDYWVRGQLIRLGRDEKTGKSATIE